MRLTAIKLAGFKSFVDATTFRAPTNLTGVVGPNGCGKSNIIDAVRWVMGEGSARVLRGELMSDVIFSGSSSRKPVGTATVELVFDNSDSQAGGEFANFNEISVRRQVGRDGISLYTLNGTRCRRKDIRDLFLGTGLGSKSYSIIEQGMISQVVDARPEEIRAHLEEAAGISKYKERRRETENRISRTRENLDRLSDLREEVGSHLSRLKRQARAAERYRKLKKQRRELESKLLALQWREQMKIAGRGKEALDVRETALQKKIAGQRAAEKDLEDLHQRQADASEAFNEVQGELYAVGSDIARLEQTVQHNREMQARQLQEYEETSASLKDLEQHMVLDRAQVEELTGKLAESEPVLKQAETDESAADRELLDAEAEVQAWQERLEENHRVSTEFNRSADGLRARIEVLDQRMAAAAARTEELQGQAVTVDTEPMSQALEELGRLHSTAATEEAAKQRELDDARLELSERQESVHNLATQEYETQRSLHSLEGRLAALQTLQEAAGGAAETRAWLAEQQLDDAPQLVASLKTEKGWEVAVETVLGHWLEAVVVPDPSRPSAELGALEDATLGLLGDATGQVRARTGTLAEKVKAPDAVIAMLNHVRVADNLQAAMEFLEHTGEEESAITRDGEWIGPGWARIARGPVGQAGMLEREQEIGTLGQDISSTREKWQKLQSESEAEKDTIHDLEEAITVLQGEANTLHRIRTELESQLGGDRERISDLAERSAQIGREMQSLEVGLGEDAGSIKAARRELETVLEKMTTAEAGRAELDSRRQTLLDRRDTARQAARLARDSRYELALTAGSQRASLDSLNQSLARMDSQVSQLQQRYLALSEAISRAADPEKESKAEMDALLERRIEVEKRLGEARDRLQRLEEQYRELDATRQKSVQAVEELRSALEKARLQQQEVELNARNLQRQVEDLGEDVSDLAESLPEGADSATWETDIERLSLRISRLEPVNLAAIQEYEEELKRKEYLDAQNEDLTEALATLEGAIAKIDRKTRTRFKDTFERVNKGVQDLFPRLFGGGHAYLEMTGEDLLTTGVSIMARPPGKRVSSIHLLSGGEKALTAVAFVFAIFRLNPAPFCLLDEVDAPLDDANVGRFSALVKEMSEAVQFIIVTHNKITMEMVHQLSGVTMREPGVSRLVQVDIAEAARLAAR
jgi:chromosome segregation protein